MEPFIEIENSVGMAFATNIKDILTTGDFNLICRKLNTSRKVQDIWWRKAKVKGVQHLTLSICLLVHLASSKKGLL